MTREPYRVEVTATARRCLRRLPEKIVGACIEFIAGPLAKVQTVDVAGIKVMPPALPSQSAFQADAHRLIARGQPPLDGQVSR